MRKWTLPFVTAALVVAIAFVGYTSAGEGKDKYKNKDKSAAASIGQPAPALSLPDQTGKTVNLADYSGKIVVLEWFNEQCPIVVRHYEQGDTMNKLVSKWSDKDVVWLAINSTSGSNNESNKAAAAEWNINRPVLNDASGQVGRMYGAKTTPHMYIIDTNGVLAYMGAIDDDPRGNKSNRVNYVDKALTEITSGQSVSEPQTKAYGCNVKYAN